MNFSAITLACIVLCAAAAVTAEEYDIVVQVEGKALVCLGMVLNHSGELVLGVDGKVKLGSTGEVKDTSTLWAEVDPNLAKNFIVYIRKSPKSNTDLWRRVITTKAVKSSVGSHILSINLHCSGIEDQKDQNGVTAGILPSLY